MRVNLSGPYLVEINKGRRDSRTRCVRAQSNAEGIQPHICDLELNLLIALIEIPIAGVRDWLKNFHGRILLRFAEGGPVYAQFRLAFPRCLLPGGSQRDPNGTGSIARRWNGTEWNETAAVTGGGGSVTDPPIDCTTIRRYGAGERVTHRRARGKGWRAYVHKEISLSSARFFVFSSSRIHCYYYRM